MSHEVNLARIKAVHNALGDMQNLVVFVGGSTISLYADQHAFEFRGTDDVDVIIEIANYPEHARFEEQLRARGFVDDVESPASFKRRLPNVVEECSVGHRCECDRRSGI